MLRPASAFLLISDGWNQWIRRQHITLPRSWMRLLKKGHLRDASDARPTQRHWSQYSVAIPLRSRNPNRYFRNIGRRAPKPDPGMIVEKQPGVARAAATPGLTLN